MTTFDQILFNVFNHFKKRLPKKANSIAIGYITLLQASIVLFLGVFFSVFLRQMHVSTMSSNKAWILFGVACIGLYFKNWIQYSGKKRIALNAKKTKVKSKSYNIYLLWFLPIAILGLSIILMQA
jgi:hypothetical protein